MNGAATASSGKGKASLVASYLFSLSLFSLAGSVVYFTYEVVIISKQIPEILLRVDTTSEKLEPIIDDVGNIIDMVVPLLCSELTSIFPL